MITGSSSDELSGELAPPMANGEVIFEAPWQGRVFGMARSLADAGMYTWDEFRAHLIDVIGDWDRNADTVDEYAYYEHFLAAFEALLAEKRLLGREKLAERAAEFDLRPHGHDHDHDHDHNRRHDR